MRRRMLWADLCQFHSPSPNNSSAWLLSPAPLQTDSLVALELNLPVPWITGLDALLEVAQESLDLTVGRPPRSE